MRLVPIVLVVASAVLIVFGRLRKITLVAVAGYVLLALAAGLEFYIRSH
jgi:hypothetical protein